MSGILSRDVVAGGHRLRVYEAGDPTAPTILWLHGSGPGAGALSNWLSLLQSMPAWRHVAPDLLGFADSEHPDLPPGIPATVAARAASVLDLLDELGLEKVHVVGNSMGGMITLRLLLEAPERFDRAILMGSGGAPVSPTEDLIRMITFYNDPTPGTMQDLIGRFVYDTAMLGDRLQEISEDRTAVAIRPDVRGSHQTTFAPGEAPLVYSPEELATITQEVLLVHGREDRMIPREASWYFEEHLPNAQLHVLPHAGHWVQIEQVDRFRALAELFLHE
ncbi:alpha/beta fold hydrolase [Raineyella fluvialis]|uniref:Alpha/beta fold hydrolase n=1 Tax=Raineyella fluvialis TaxID=2662261 RepID=A0A5Q2FHH5_9ACTN|nr:alpha/beta hydrolase [Raineyella fluvialis]QGF23786.1 alpha/beta fold hydrolase [Raineyella fluvialis]